MNNHSYILPNIICTYFVILIFFNQIFGCENKLSDWREPKTKITVFHNLFLKSKKIIIFKFQQIRENGKSPFHFKLEGLNSIFIKKRKKKKSWFVSLRRGAAHYSLVFVLFTCTKQTSIGKKNKVNLKEQMSSLYCTVRAILIPLSQHITTHLWQHCKKKK